MHADVVVRDLRFSPISTCPKLVSVPVLWWAKDELGELDEQDEVDKVLELCGRKILIKRVRKGKPFLPQGHFPFIEYALNIVYDVYIYIYTIECSQENRNGFLLRKETETGRRVEGAVVNKTGKISVHLFALLN